MKVKYADGSIQIDLCELLDLLSPEQKLSMAESLSCDDVIIGHVAEQIINRWTENGFFGGVSCLANEQAYHGLDKAWRDVAKASGDVAKREIERLETALTSEKASHQRTITELETYRRPRYA